MSQNNSLAMKQQPKFSVAITTAGYQKLINNTLGDPERSKRFVASITSAVAGNAVLQSCDAGTILAGALLGESLNLSPSPQLGQFYLVPFDCKVKDANGKQLYVQESGKSVPMTEKKAQFILGYKGYIQLAIRSGQYKKLNVMEIKEGELRSFDPLNETIDCILIEDWEAREKAPTVGYYAMFEYINGFRKAIYWSKGKMISHANQYSSAFNAAAYFKIQNGEIPEQDMWKYSSFWYKNFDDMAKKTMLRQLISRWGVMSSEMQRAYERDASFVEVNHSGFLPPSFEPDDNPIEDVIQADAHEVSEKVDLNEV